MKDFYVYRINTNVKGDQHVLGFIDDIAKFIQVYNPDTMEYTGIKITTNSIVDAQYVYENPTSDRGEYSFCDEPKATQAVRAIEDLQKNVRRQNIKILSQRFMKVNVNLVTSLSNMARHVYEGSNKSMSVEDIYELLKKNWAKEFVKSMGYINGR